MAAPAELLMQLQQLQMGQDSLPRDGSPIPIMTSHGRTSSDSPFANAPFSSSGGADSSSSQSTSPDGVALMDSLLQQSTSPPSGGQDQGDQSEQGDMSTKNQICFDFTKGLCTRGDKCKYSHDLATIVTFNSREKGICFDYLRNQCHRGLLCRFSHDLSNIAQQCQVHNGAATKGRTNAICYDFVKGVCQRGNDCRYSHDLSLIARTARGGAQNQKTGEICYDFLRGRCSRGSSCKYSHNISFLAAPSFLAGALSNGSASAQGQTTQQGVAGSSVSAAGLSSVMSLPPANVSASSGLATSMSADPAAMSAIAAAAAASTGMLSTSLSNSLPPELSSGHTLSASLSSELNDTMPRHIDQPAANAGQWSGTANAAAYQARAQAMANTQAAAVALAQQRQFAAVAAANGFNQQLNNYNQLQQAVKAAQMAGASSDGMNQSNMVNSGFAAVAVQQQAMAAAQQARAAMMAAPPQSDTNNTAVSLARTHSAPANVPLPGVPGGAMTAESITAILSNLGEAHPALLAETLTGLAVAAQAQAHAAMRMSGPGGPPSNPRGPGLPPMAPGAPHSAPQPIPGRYDGGSNGGSNGGSANGRNSFSEGFNGPNGAQLMPSGSLPDHLSRSMTANGINPAAISSDLLPLLKEIWNK